MSKNVPSAIQTTIDARSTSLARCWKITRLDGTTYGFTEFNNPLSINADGNGAITYQPDLTFNTEAFSYSDEMEVDGTSMVGVIDSSLFSEADLIAGKFDGATVLSFLVDWNNVAGGVVKLLKGKLGEFERKDFGFRAECRGLSQYLQNNIVSLYTPRCRSKFGDTGVGTSGGCNFDLYSKTQTCTVQSVASRKQFNVTGLVGPILAGTGGVKIGGYFNLGKVTFLTGANAGIIKEINTFVDLGDPFTITLFLALPFDLQIGDALSIVPGCDKTLEVCRDNWNNLVNFRGEPWLPGEDILFQVSIPPKNRGGKKG